jgi:carotenoid cleavage dioxygenase
MSNVQPMSRTEASKAGNRESLEAYRNWWIKSWMPADPAAPCELTRIEGEVPREIHGTLYRNGPSQRILPRRGYEALHLFDGDGLVHAFRFDDGRVHYTGRYVEDPTHLVEKEEGKFCLTAVGTAADAPTDRLPMRQQHNTNVVWHAGKLMALVENAYPFELDARSLAPKGENDFGGKWLGMSVSAHPKIDARTGQMLIHGYQPFPPYVQWYAVEADGRCSHAEAVDAPYPAMMHELAITEHYIIFLVCPIVMNAEALMSGRPLADALNWEPERGLRFGVKRRDGSGEVRWFEAPSAGYIFHIGNAYEDGDRISMDACTYPDGGALLDALRGWRAGNLKPGWHARPFLYELDLATGACRETKFDDGAAEFPRIDDRLVGYANRYGYAVRGRKVAGGGEPLSVVVRYDRRGGPSAHHDFGPGRFPSEPVFVPRSSDAREEDGFVLCTVYDGPEDASYVVVLDAQNLAREPLARARLPRRIPMGFHGNFAPGVV